MQAVLANLDGVDLHLETLVYEQVGVKPLPFQGMDSKSMNFFSNKRFALMMKMK